MLSKFIRISLIFTGVFSFTSYTYGQDTTYIKTLVESAFPSDSLYIGTACHEWFLGTKTEEILNAEFNYVTPANDFKQSYIHPEPGKWKWERSDNWMKHVQNTGQVLRLHAPISPQASTWAKEDHRTAEELENMLVEYITGLGERYNDCTQIIWLDVVNEILNADGTWFGPKEGTEKWENPWPKMGYDTTVQLQPPIYIKRAFEVATEHCSNFKFIINQHSDTKESWDKLKEVVSYLRSHNLRVDGVGWQAHLWAGWEKEEGNMERLYHFIDWCHANDLEFHITEFNSWIEEPHEEKWKMQAETFYAVTKMAASKYTSGIVGINFWHIRGVETQNKDRDGGPWSEDYLAKPGYYDTKRALYEIATNIGPTCRNSPAETAIIDQEYQFTPDLLGTIGTPSFEFTTQPAAAWLLILEDGTLSGTPSDTNKYQVKYTITDDVGTRTIDFELNVYDELLQINSDPVNNATEGYFYEYQPVYTGEGDWTFSISPQADWINMDDFGRLHGVPDQAGTYDIIMTLTRHDQVVKQEFTLEVFEKLEILSEPKTEATEESLYRYQINYKGYGEFRITTQPEASWLSISQDGLLSGTPPTADTIRVTITAQNDLTTDTQEFELFIAEKLEILSEPLTNAYVGKPYQYQVKYSGIGEFKISSMDDISWLSINESGLLQGTPQERDTINVKLKFKNEANTVFQVFNIYIFSESYVIAKKETSIHFYPNPATNKITINHSHQDADLSIIDQTGRVYYKTNSIVSPKTIYLDRLCPGIYFLVIDQVTSKIVIQ